MKWPRRHRMDMLSSKHRDKEKHCGYFFNAINFSDSVSNVLFLIISRSNQVKVTFSLRGIFSSNTHNYQQADSCCDPKGCDLKHEPRPWTWPLDQQLTHTPSHGRSIIAPFCFTVYAVVWADMSVNMWNLSHILNCGSCPCTRFLLLPLALSIWTQLVFSIRVLLCKILIISSPGL